MICAPAAKRPDSAGGYGAEGRERREDGADDHPPPRGKLGVCAVGSSGRAQSPRGAAASKVGSGRFWVLFRNRQPAHQTLRTPVIPIRGVCGLQSAIAEIRSEEVQRRPLPIP